MLQQSGCFSRAMYWVTMSHTRASNSLQQAEAKKRIFLTQKERKEKKNSPGKMKT